MFGQEVSISIHETKDSVSAYLLEFSRDTTESQYVCPLFLSYGPSCDLALLHTIFKLCPCHAVGNVSML